MSHSVLTMYHQMKFCKHTVLTVVPGRVVHHPHHFRVQSPGPGCADGVVPSLPNLPKLLRVAHGLHPAGQFRLAVLAARRQVAHHRGVVQAVQLLLDALKGPGGGNSRR